MLLLCSFHVSRINLVLLHFFGLKVYSCFCEFFYQVFHYNFGNFPTLSYCVDFSSDLALELVKSEKMVQIEQHLSFSPTAAVVLLFQLFDQSSDIVVYFWE